MSTTTPIGESLGAASSLSRNLPAERGRKPAAGAQTEAKASTVASVSEPVPSSQPMQKASVGEKQGGSLASPEKTAERIRQLVQHQQDRLTAVRFDIDQSDNKIVVRIVNKNSGEVVRQIPPDELIELSKRLEDLKGVLFDQIS